MNPAYDFRDRVAVVTGAGSGTGLATAQAFAEAGAAVVLADRNEQALESVTSELTSAGRQGLGVACDVADEEQVAALVERAVATFGRLDFAFNNAGIQAPSRFPSMAATPPSEPLRPLLALLATCSLSACGGDDDGDRAAGAPEASTPAPSPSPSLAAGAQAGTPIRIGFGGTELTARLLGNAAARDLAAQLPLTLTFRDHNNVEKTAPLPRELSLDGAPEGHDPAAGDVGYWAPDGDLVFYYDSDAPYFGGIVRIGEFDGELDALERQGDDFSATIGRAD